MKHISNEKFINTFATTSSDYVATVKSGETFVVDTLDCFGNKITCESQTLSSLPWDNINPCTGPIGVENAHVGDILKIEILDIDLGRNGIIIKDFADLESLGLNEKDKSIVVEITDSKYILLISLIFSLIFFKYSYTACIKDNCLIELLVK